MSEPLGPRFGLPSLGLFGRSNAGIFGICVESITSQLFDVLQCVSVIVGPWFAGKAKMDVVFLGQTLEFFRLFSAIKDREAVLGGKTKVWAKSLSGDTVEIVLGEGELLFLCACVSWVHRWLVAISAEAILGDSAPPEICLEGRIGFGSVGTMGLGAVSSRADSLKKKNFDERSRSDHQVKRRSKPCYTLNFSSKFELKTSPLLPPVLLLFSV